MISQRSPRQIAANTNHGQNIPSINIYEEPIVDIIDQTQYPSISHQYPLKQSSALIFEKCYNSLLTTLDDKITFVNMVNVITRSTEIVDSYKKLSGIEKKMMVIKMVTTLIEKHEKDAKMKKALVDLLNTLGVSVIDTIIYASKGKLAINVKYFGKLRQLKCWC
uniref:Uncharacterized protein n=1 Tax=Pyramimonas orientalis virus TaxID=455367 RepID=A0A7M3UNQ7_POV01|nr:hypothetical protein HWQ62_00197 [Pyramimonas orientalis virus]